MRSHKLSGAVEKVSETLFFLQRNYFQIVLNLENSAPHHPTTRNGGGGKGRGRWYINTTFNFLIQ